MFHLPKKLESINLNKNRIELLLELTDFLLEKSDDTEVNLESLSYLPSSSANWANILIAIIWTFVWVQEKMELKKMKLI